MAFKRKTIGKRPRKVYKRRSTMIKRAAIKKVVRREISRNNENKSKQQFVASKPLYAVGNVAFPDNVIPLGPTSGALDIIQGTGAGERVGNRIKTKRLVFKGVLTPEPYNATTNAVPRPQLVKMVLFYDRDDPNDIPIPAATFFQDGSSSTGFTNSMLDTIRPYNKDRYRVLYQRTFKLGFAAYEGATANAGNQTNFQAYANNDYKLSQTFYVDVTKLYPQMVKFNDNNTNPTTRGVYALFYAIAADGAANATTSIPADITYMQDYHYEDA